MTLHQPPAQPLCPGCGADPSRAGVLIGKASRHCESPLCTWARCTVCKTIWNPKRGGSYTDE